MRAIYFFIFPLRVGHGLAIISAMSSCIHQSPTTAEQCVKPHDATNSVFKLTNNEEQRIYTLCWGLRHIARLHAACKVHGSSQLPCSDSFLLLSGDLDDVLQHQVVDLRHLRLCCLQIWVKPSAEMQYMYGNHVMKSGLGRITENTPAYTGVVIYSMSDIPLGFGVTAKSTADCRKMDPSGIVVFHQADVGE